MNLRTSFKLILSAILCFVLSSCNSTPKTHQHRKVASLDGKSEDALFNSLFNSFVADTEGDLEIVKPFSRTSLQILKRSYYYLEKFDAELDRIHKNCIALRAVNVDGTCENPMLLPDYVKLQASRIILDRQKARLSYHYKRLLDLANSQDDTLKLAFEETESYLSQLSAEEQNDRARVARGVLTQWNAELRDLIQISTSTEGPISYELAIDLFKLKESSHQEWSEMVGLDFSPSDLLNDVPDVVSEFENRADALNAEKREAANIADSPELTQVYNELKFVNDRAPQSVSWKNHTGRSFGRGQWALTYDDGPKSSTTNQILDTLASRGWHATFFWLAKNVKSSSNAKVVQRTKAMGMGLAHHSYTHANLGKSGANLSREIRDAKSALESVYGRRLNYFRLPYGSGTKSSRVKNMITSLNMEHFFWNVDSLDWKKSSAEQIYARTKKQMDVQGKGILLFHDIHQRTVETTRLLARRLPNLNVIKLENGAGIQSRANSGGSATTGWPAPTTPTPSVAFAPHTRTIKASVLNVRVNGEGTTACGEFHKGDRIEVIDRNNDGWFRVNISSTPPRPKTGNFNHSCRSGWISGLEIFSE